MIRIYCEAADAVLKETQTLTAGMTNYPEVILTFSDDWDGFGKAVVVRAGDADPVGVLVVNNKFIVPHECLTQSGVNLIVGVSGTNGTSTIPTIWCSCGEIMDSVDIDEPAISGGATPTLVNQMLGYAQQVAAEAEELESYIVKTVAVDDTDAGNWGKTDVTISDSGEGENRTLTFTFSNLKGRGIKNVIFTPSGENKGRIQVKIEDLDAQGQVTEQIVNYDGVKEAIAAMEALMSATGTAETERAAAETARDSAETLRDTAEQTREQNEDSRVSAETARQNAEGLRDSNEGVRIANEAQRETNENTRQSNEANRVANFETMSDTFEDWSTVDALNGHKSEGFAVGEEDGEPVPSDSPYYQNNAKYYNTEAGASAASANVSDLKAEGYAVGKQNGTDVGSTSPYFHNNAAFYADVAGQGAATAGYMDLYVDADGHLIMERSSNVNEDFEIDEDGHLIWEVG